MCYYDSHDFCPHKELRRCINRCVLDASYQIPTVPRSPWCENCLAVGADVEAENQMLLCAQTQAQAGHGIGIGASAFQANDVPSDHHPSMVQHMTEPGHHIARAHPTSYTAVRPLPAFAAVTQPAPKSANAAEKMTKLHARRADNQRRQQRPSAHQAQHSSLPQITQRGKSTQRLALERDVREREVQRQAAEQQQHIKRKLQGDSAGTVAEKEEREAREQAERESVGQGVLEGFGPTARETEEMKARKQAAESEAAARKVMEQFGPAARERVAKEEREEAEWQRRKQEEDALLRKEDAQLREARGQAVMHMFGSTARETEEMKTRRRAAESEAVGRKVLEKFGRASGSRTSGWRGTRGTRGGRKAKARRTECVFTTMASATETSWGKNALVG